MWTRFEKPTRYAVGYHILYCEQVYPLYISILTYFSFELIAEAQHLWQNSQNAMDVNPWSHIKNSQIDLSTDNNWTCRSSRHFFINSISLIKSLNFYLERWSFRRTGQARDPKIMGPRSRFCDWYFDLPRSRTISDCKSAIRDRNRVVTKSDTFFSSNWRINVRCLMLTVTFKIFTMTRYSIADEAWKASYHVIVL